MSNIAQDVYSTLLTATDEIKPMREKMAALQKDNDSGRYAQPVIEANKAEMAKLARDIDETAARTMTTVRECIDKHREAVLALDDVRGEEMTPDAALLNCGVELTSRDVVKMLDRNRDNSTMLQLILRYAKAHGIDTQGYIYRDHSQEAKEMEGFYGTANMYIDHWFNTDRNYTMLNKFFGVEG